jgi:hypothetical protein
MKVSPLFLTSYLPESAGVVGTTSAADSNASIPNVASLLPPSATPVARTANTIPVDPRLTAGAKRTLGADGDGGDDKNARSGGSTDGGVGDSGDLNEDVLPCQRRKGAGVASLRKESISART